MVGEWGKETPTARGATPSEMARARLLRSACIAPSGSLPVAVTAPVQEVVPVVPSATSALKNSVLDVTDESEIPVASPDKVRVWFRNYAELKGGMLMVDHEPTPEQISALEA
eukprot:4297475-Amphidinium_carterae.1